MIQVKVIAEVSIGELNNTVNSFLAGLSTEAVKDIKINEKDLTAVIVFEHIEAWQGRMCAECKYWDDGGLTDTVSGICHECGQRRRFNCRACKAFKDVRG